MGYVNGEFNTPSEKPNTPDYLSMLKEYEENIGDFPEYPLNAINGYLKFIYGLSMTNLSLIPEHSNFYNHKIYESLTRESLNTSALKTMLEVLINDKCSNNIPIEKVGIETFVTLMVVLETEYRNEMNNFRNI